MGDLDLTEIKKRAVQPEWWAYELGEDALALMAEVEQLRAALLEEQTVHAKTFDNFEAHLESCTEERNTVLDERDRLQREVEGLRAWRDGNHDEHRNLRAALQLIGTECANYTSGQCEAPRSPYARYGAERWCDQCIARAGLAGTLPPDPQVVISGG